MPHQSYKTVALIFILALVKAHSLGASFDSLVADLGLSKDSQIATTRSRLSSIFDLKEGTQLPPKKGEKVVVKRTPLEQDILKLHKALVDLGVETHPLDRDLWKSFLINVNACMGVGESVKQSFRKNQIAELGKSLSRLLESYENDLVVYFSRETPQMLGKSILAVDKIEARYLALYRSYEFMAKYWANDQAGYVAPLMILAMQLSQAKLIEEVFETEYITQLDKQREERRKIKLEKEKEHLEEEKEKGEEVKSLVEDQLEEPQKTVEVSTLSFESTVQNKEEDLEITRDEITPKQKDILKFLKGRLLPEDVKLWDHESELTYKDLKNLIQRYQTPFDEIANLVFPKPKVPEPKKEEGEEKDDSETSIKQEKEDVPEVLPYAIPEPLKDFKHPGIFSTLKKKVGLEKADYYLFLRCLSLLEGNKLEKAKEKWQMHRTKGEDRDSKKVINDSKFEAFFEAYKNWSTQNKELLQVRTERAPSKTLADSYNRFTKEHGEKLKDMEEEKLKQLMNMIVGLHAWEYHKSLQKKSQPKKTLKPFEEDLGKIWIESL